MKNLFSFFNVTRPLQFVVCLILFSTLSNAQPTAHYPSRIILDGSTYWMPAQVPVK